MYSITTAMAIIVQPPPPQLTSSRQRPTNPAISEEERAAQNAPELSRDDTPVRARTTRPPSNGSAGIMLTSRRTQFQYANQPSIQAPVSGLASSRWTNGAPK